MSKNNVFRFATHSLCFMDACCKGLSATQLAWAMKKYHGHCTIPETILQELEKAGIH
ncbi:hypothetical protein BJ165DRAFT_1358864 [Panaeolus papilionaceus]|nr:hypothetical protein BJ165DRAFT_1358864 [Panaeolus papilionaceus]